MSTPSQYFTDLPASSPIRDVVGSRGVLQLSLEWRRDATRRRKLSRGASSRSALRLAPFVLDRQESGAVEPGLTAEFGLLYAGVGFPEGDRAMLDFVEHCGCE